MHPEIPWGRRGGWVADEGSREAENLCYLQKELRQVRAQWDVQLSAE